MILFGRERRLYFSDVWVQCGRFTETDKSDIFDHIEIYDHLPLANGFAAMPAALDAMSRELSMDEETCVGYSPGAFAANCKPFDSKSIVLNW
jgi:hypothetical protein